MADMDCLVCGRLSAECHVYLVGVNVHVESFVVCIVGKMAKDVGMKLLWCHSHQVWLINF